jgi:hypothetical protein
MQLNVIYRKTAKGEESIRHRTDDLPSDLRMVLLLINGMRDVGTLRMVSEHCRDSLAPLIFLEDNGYIEIVTAQSNVVAMAGGTRPAAPAAYAPPAPMPAAPVAPPAPVYAPPPQAMPAAPMPGPASYSVPTSGGSESILAHAQSQHLQEKVGGLMSYITRALGDDAKMVQDRILAVRSDQDFQDVVKKLYTIIHDYRGVKEAERFMQSFGR